tara:strand:- start:1647 stop:1829 length:183 start_codon:yes stop_codon:yes gene_type:complete
MERNISNNFDIRELMDYDTIKNLLIKLPTELSLFEISCILINNKVNEKIKDKEIQYSKKN